MQGNRDCNFYVCGGSRVKLSRCDLSASMVSFGLFVIGVASHAWASECTFISNTLGNVGVAQSGSATLVGNCIASRSKAGSGFDVQVIASWGACMASRSMAGIGFDVQVIASWGELGSRLGGCTAASCIRVGSGFDVQVIAL